MSFVQQETKFPFEVIVHDDASTDATPAIIEQYEEAYPWLFRCIYQQENQYSKRIAISSFVDKIIQGRYVALCEGDDWWTDTLKLQKQFDWMQAHPDISGCVHAVKKIDARTGRSVGAISPCSREKDYSTAEVISRGGGLFGTNSLFFKRELYVLREPYLGWRVGDYPRFLQLADSGGIHYLPETMSCYRVNVPHSWTTHISETESDYAEHIRHIEGKLHEYDAFTNRKYHRRIQAKILRNRLAMKVKKIHSLSTHSMTKS